MPNKGNIQELSFVEVNPKGGLSYYPAKTVLTILDGEDFGRKNTEELVEFYKNNGFQKEIISKMLVSLIGIDPANDELNEEQKAIISNIKGIVSVAHYYLEIGIEMSKQQ
jgi:hypothetical protein